MICIYAEISSIRFIFSFIFHFHFFLFSLFKNLPFLLFISNFFYLYSFPIFLLFILFFFFDIFFYFCLPYLSYFFSDIFLPFFHPLILPIISSFMSLCSGFSFPFDYYIFQLIFKTFSIFFFFYFYYKVLSFFSILFISYSNFSVFLRYNPYKLFLKSLRFFITLDFFVHNIYKILIFLFIIRSFLFPSSIGWRCGIHRLHLCRGVRASPTIVLDMTLKNVMVSLH